MIDIDAQEYLHPGIIFFQCRDTLYTVAVSRAGRQSKALGAAMRSFVPEKASKVWDAVTDYLKSQDAMPKIPGAL